MVGEPERLDKDDARQGETGHNVRYVLMIGLALAVVVFVGLMIWISTQGGLDGRVK